ncbi:uncharacterized protein LOC109599737 isoform X2 [Aethina tumida]|uniref:uncharacterized protein LOC109599737 isoform X2 n=1 Tax=Aethina tumida TaxID=116153 RepID=UPI00214861F3|nr:uncharacterized protein LOC109599737 isoform X2 [Aethina tumida]
MWEKIKNVFTNGMDSNELRWTLTLWMLGFFVGLLYFLDVFQIEEYYTITNAPAPNHRFQTKESLKGFLVKTKGCRIPYMDPMDKTIIKFIEKYDPPVCNKGIPALYESNFTSLFLLNSSLPFYNVTDPGELKCCYQAVERKVPRDDERDDKFRVNASCISFGESVNITDEYVMVKCYVNETRIYKDVFWFVPSKVNATQRRPVARRPLNVLIVGLDAVSRLNLHRQMPKTVGYLKEIDAVELLGYNKVGDNTFPNLIPVLTGLFEDELGSTCWKKGGHFDNCTYLWDLYKEKGFMTSFGEDAAWMGIFNYVRQGFINQPTDYAYGYFNKFAEGQIGNSHNLNVDECIGARDIYKDLLKYITRLTSRFHMEDTPYFAFYWGASLSHDYLNKPSIGDQIYLEFFKDLKKNGYLDNTALFFMSDHGIRWGGIRQTFMGRMEERLPFLYVRLPDQYKKEFAQAYNNLKENVHRLTTPFDLHETLKDLLNPFDLTDTVLHNRNDSNNRGISLFSEIPGDRTCQSAAIQTHWCTCQSSLEIDKNSSMVVEASSYAVAYMNKLLQGHGDCADLALDEVINARALTHGDHISLDDHKVFDYMITLKTAPGGGVFETTVRALKNKKFEVLGTISRLNLYGKQSACITDFHLKLYCYCKTFSIWDSGKKLGFL